MKRSTLINHIRDPRQHDLGNLGVALLAAAYDDDLARADQELAAGETKPLQEVLETT